MALTKEKTLDQIEIVANGIIQVREVTHILEDGKVLSSSYHRSSFSPGDDVSIQDARVQSVAEAVWTKEVISTYQEQIANSGAA